MSNRLNTPSSCNSHANRRVFVLGFLFKFIIITITTIINYYYYYIIMMMKVKMMLVMMSSSIILYFIFETKFLMEASNYTWASLLSLL